MDEVVIWLIAIPLIILEIIMIVKFFQIASDIRALKHYLVDGYKTIKEKDKDGITTEFKCYKEDLLKDIPYENWKKTRADVLKPIIEAYNKQHQKTREYYQQANAENNDTQEQKKDNNEEIKTTI